jgi:acetyltransferase-like isoleucine patch superfamily enzyme
MGHVISTVLRSAIAGVIRLLLKLYSKFEPVFEMERKKAYIKSLGSCHRDVQFHFPISIEPKSKVVIEEDVAIAQFVQIWAHGGVSIGRNTLIASHVIITSSTHDYLTVPIRSKRIDKPVKIGADVWIGSGAVIMPGVTIGDGAVVGAGAIVLHDVPQNTVVVGNPARVLKNRFDR